MTTFEEFQTVRTAIESATSWSGFAASLISQLHSGKGWSDKQFAAAKSMAEKINAPKDKVEADLTAVRGMFEIAVSSGYKRPTYRAEGLVISRAPDSGKNPGALYVKRIEDDEYLGKILGTTYTGKPAPGLAVIAEDPLAAAIRFGRLTGTCACCGRELTNGASIELGIGPVCKKKWGL